MPKDPIPRLATWLKAQNRSPHTVAGYLRDLKAIRPHLPDGIDYLSAGADDLAFALVSLQSSRLLAPITRCRMQAALKAFYRWAEASGVRRDNPAREMRMSRPNEKPVEWIEEPQVERLLHAVVSDPSTTAQRDCAMIATFLYTGLRLAEVAALRWEDLDAERRIMRVRTKGGHRQTRIIPAKLDQILHAYRKTQGVDPNGPLFPNRRGDPISSRHIARRLAVWAEKAGLGSNVHPHQLRHTFATRLYRSTGDLRLVQRALGHKTIASTQRYLHTDDAQLRDAIEALA